MKRYHIKIEFENTIDDSFKTNFNYFDTGYFMEILIKTIFKVCLCEILKELKPNYSKLFWNARSEEQFEIQLIHVYYDLLYLENGEQQYFMVINLETTCSILLWLQSKKFVYIFLA